MAQDNNDNSIITRNYKDEIQELFRIPGKILSNRELQFTSKFIKELLKALETKRTLSTAYYPQTNSQTERMNQEIKVLLRYYINYQQNN